MGKTRRPVEGALLTQDTVSRAQVLGERGVLRNLSIETQKPALCHMHAQFLHQRAFAADAVQVTNGRMRSRSSGSIEGRPVSL